eukprot:6187843-Pleurochrysis_carterae.AAC.1
MQRPQRPKTAEVHATETGYCRRESTQHAASADANEHGEIGNEARATSGFGDAEEDSDTQNTPARIEQEAASSVGLSGGRGGRGERASARGKGKEGEARHAHWQRRSVSKGSSTADSAAAKEAQGEGRVWKTEEQFWAE